VVNHKLVRHARRVAEEAALARSLQQVLCMLNRSPRQKTREGCIGVRDRAKMVVIWHARSFFSEKLWIGWYALTFFLMGTEKGPCFSPLWVVDVMISLLECFRTFACRPCA
jgi:hypothetical protein